MSHRIICFLLAFLALSGCATTSYDVSLQTVERGVEAIELPPGKTATYEDDLVKIQWAADSEFIHMILSNKSNSTITIPWDEVSYVDPSGLSHRVIHKGRKLINADQVQPPSTVARGANLDEFFTPAENVQWVNYGYGGHWDIAPLLTKKEMGSTVKVLLPLKFSDVQHDYLFALTIDIGE